MSKFSVKLLVLGVFCSGVMFGEYSASYAMMKSRKTTPPTQVKEIDDYSTKEEIYTVANQEARDANASALRSLRLLEETTTILTDTGVELRKQGEQIANSTRGVEMIESNAKQSERKLNSIESPWGTLANKIKPTPKQKSGFSFKALKPKKNKDKQKKQEKQTKQSADNGKKQVQLASGSEQEFAETMEKNELYIDKMISQLDNLITLSKDIGQELAVQQEDLDYLQKRTESANRHMANVVKQTSALVRK